MAKESVSIDHAMASEQVRARVGEPVMSSLMPFQPA
eukprot:CAMPEP_0197904792 /NCGR_PEP_ID=MMETSP1439-20131203/58784_1 /TAXON_ID=66791 /ORGANISM="Gonyaulax spinifera, Strain CCMP409" /LENGTH=35 /DNA_ID= /DNA_START= /DNA_END= /DNA_ORIENTATION=